MGAVFNHALTSTTRLPPDAHEASWSWRWEPQYVVRGYDGRISGVKLTHKYLTCRIIFAGVVGFDDLVVTAAEHHGEQQASATYRRPISRGDWASDLVIVAATRLGDFNLRVVAAKLNPNAQVVTAWLHPSQAVAYVETLEAYTTKWRRGEYVDF